MGEVSSSQEVDDEVQMWRLDGLPIETWQVALGSRLAPTTALEIITMRGGKICDILLDDNTAS